MSQTKSDWKSKLESLSQLRHLPRAFRLIQAASGRWTIWWAILLLLQGLLPIVTVYLLRSFVNSLSSAAGANTQQALQKIFVLLGLIIVVQVVGELFRVLVGYVKANQSELVQDHITKLIHGQSLGIDLGFYESPDFYDHLHRAREDSSNRPVALVESTGSLVQSGVTLIAMSIVLLHFGLWIPLALVLSALPALYIAVRYTIRQHAWSVQTTADRRHVNYFSWCLTSKDVAAEVRLFGLGSYFQSCYRSLREKLRSQRLRLMRDQYSGELGAGIIGYVVAAASVAWVVWQTIHGKLSLGDVALFYQAFYQGQRLMRSVLENLGNLYSNSLFLGNLFEFLDLKPAIQSPANIVRIPELKNAIEFDSVTFHYPGTSRKALTDFHLTVPSGKIIAIVGPNGAGKSTVIKLLCRFYDPDAGSVKLDGIDLREMELEKLRQFMTVQFQLSVHYAATARENISYGDLFLDSPNGSVATAARAAQADETIMRLRDGYETQLGTWFVGGLELSIGEWRRISLARALYRQAPIILLDEPTSAMDSWAEMNWMNRFRKAVEGRTAILITHRFPTAMHADMIHVMQEGRIVESGNHDSLIELGGLYSQSWRNQTQMSPAPLEKKES
jgi:ATP-binding cassette subfamily B protein